MFTPILFSLALCVQQIAAVDLVVDLGYSKYRGSEVGDGVSRWAGVRYARSASRVDGMRFMAPQDPVEVKGTVNATEVRLVQLDSNQTNDNLVWTTVHWHKQQPGQRIRRENVRRLPLCQCIRAFKCHD
jgi:hypothetical protein